MSKHQWILLEDECNHEQLVAIAVRHTKLALEYLNRNTSIERKQTILLEISALRVEREALLSEAGYTANNKI